LNFNDLSLEVFHYQSKNNKVYAKYLSLIGKSALLPQKMEEIPFMPISFYKSHEVKSGDWTPELVFKSSGTNDMKIRSQHFVKDINWYNEISLSIYQQIISRDDAEVMALLPTYFENGNSSLVHMVQFFSDEMNQNGNHFYMDDFSTLQIEISKLVESGRAVILFGVTFALLDFAKKCPIENEKLHVVFTGGMKNKRKDLQFSDIHQELKNAFPQSKIISEYGMTELFSQAYSDEFGNYKPGQTMRVIPFQINDPLSQAPFGKTAQLGIIDLANLDTLSFILTEDAGIVKEDNRFEVLGRLHQSDMRGCNLLYEDFVTHSDIKLE